MVILQAQLDASLQKLKKYRFDIEKGINMFEAPKENHSNEYSPWNYNLLGGNSVSKTILEEDGQDLNNSMVDDLVAKILDDDCITDSDIFASRCNGAIQQYQVETPMISDYKTRLSENAYFTNASGLHTYPITRMENDSLSGIENDQDHRNIYSGLNSLSLNLCMGEQNHDKSNSYTNEYINNVQRSISASENNMQQSGQQYPSHIVDDGSFSSIRNSYIPLSNNGLITTTSGLNYNLQSTNQTDTVLSTECIKDLFGHYSQLQFCNNTNYNLNIAHNLTLDSPDNSSLNDLQHNILPNSHSNPILNIHDSYNATTNGQGYHPNSNMTDLSVDSGFISNSPMQHFSPVESVMQNYFVNNLRYSKYDEYKDYHETSNVKGSNITLSNEQLYLKQQQQNSHIYKLNDMVSSAAEQTYKRLLNYYPILSEQQQFTSGNHLNSNDGVPLMQQKFDATLFKMLNSNGNINSDTQSHENKVFLPIDYSHNLLTTSVNAREVKQLQQLRFNYQSANNYQHLIVNNADTLKTIHEQNSQTTFQNNHKRINNISSTFKMKTAYELSNGMNFSANNALSQQQHIGVIDNNSVDNDILNRLIKQRQQQQRIKNISSISSAADVLFKASLMQSTNSGVFATHTVMPISVNVPPPIPIFEGGLGIRNGNSARRSDSSKILYSRLEQTYEQFKQLEKERKKCEAGLAAHFPGKKVTSTNNIPIPRLQGSPSRVDKLIIDHFREHARVITLIAKMERLRGAEMNQRVHKAMEHWCDAIKFVQERRKQEIVNVNKRQKENIHCITIHDDNAFPDIVALADSIHTLTKASRYARTAMYNAMQSTLLYDEKMETKIVETNQDVITMLHPNEKAVTSEKISTVVEAIGVLPIVNKETTDRT